MSRSRAYSRFRPCWFVGAYTAARDCSPTGCAAMVTAEVTYDDQTYARYAEKQHGSTAPRTDGRHGDRAASPLAEVTSGAAAARPARSLRIARASALRDCRV